MGTRFPFRSRLVLLLAAISVLIIAGAAYADTVVLPHDNIPPDNLPPTKLAFLRNIEATEVAVQTAVPRASKAGGHRPSPQPTEVWPEGIMGSAIAPLPSEYYYVRNAWQGVLKGNHVQVYAGLNKMVTPPRGFLMVSTLRVNSDDTAVPSLPQGEYLLPAGSGVIDITAVNGTCLTLTTDAGTTAAVTTPTTPQTFQFDLLTRSWACGAATSQPRP
jgi:hypothetical protein